MKHKTIFKDIDKIYDKLQDEIEFSKERNLKDEMLEFIDILKLLQKAKDKVSEIQSREQK